MSTRQSILYRPPKGRRREFHIYYDLADSPTKERKVHLELNGVSIEELETTSHGARIVLVLPAELAKALRLLN